MRFLLAILFATAIFILQFHFYRKNWNKAFHVAVSYDRPYVNAGETCCLKEVIYNNKFLPIPVVYVKFKASKTFQFENEDNAAVSDFYYRNDAFSVLGYQKIIRKLSFTATVRGYYIIDSVDIVTSDLFLQHHYATILPNLTALYVLPKRLPKKSFEVIYHSIMGEVITRWHDYQDPCFFKGIRPYQPYDAVRAINWKSTAKMGKLNVNTYYPTSAAKVICILNLDTHTMLHTEHLQEFSIQIVATLAKAFIEDSIPVAVYTNGMDCLDTSVVQMESGSSISHLTSIYQCLARINLHAPLADFFSLWKKIMTKQELNIFYVLVSSYRKSDFMEHYHAYEQKGFPISLIVPEFKDIGLQVAGKNIYKWEVPSLG